MGMLNWGNAFTELGKASSAIGVEGMKATLEEQKLRLADQLSTARDIASEGRSETRIIASEGRAETREIDKETRANLFEIDREKRAIVNAPLMQNALYKGQVDLAQATSDIRVSEADKNRINETTTSINLYKNLEPLKRQAAIDDFKAKLNAATTPDALKAARQLALATHIVDPKLTIFPDSDGTVRVFDANTGKIGGVLKDAEGKPIFRKDPEELKAAVAVINYGNTNLKLAKDEFTANLDSISKNVNLMGNTKAYNKAVDEAKVNYKTAQEQIRTDMLPAMAVLMDKSAATPTVKTYSPADLARTVERSGKSEAEVRAAYAANGMEFKQ